MGYNYVTILQNIAGSASCLSCFAVVVTYLTFASLRSKQYISLVFYVALNNMLAALGLAIGRTSDSAELCWYEGITTNYNYLSSVMWITVISYKLFRLVYKCQKDLDLGNNKHSVQIEIFDSHSDAILDDIRILHVLCWGVPLIVTLLPLIDNYAYQNTTEDDDTTYANWCALQSNKTNKNKDDNLELAFWKIASFYLWVWIAIVFNIILLYKTKKLIKSTFHDNYNTNLTSPYYISEDLRNIVKETTDKLKFFPMILIVCWLPSTFIDVLNYDKNAAGYNIATLLTLLQGFLTSLVFFMKNSEVRNKWYHLFQSIYHCTIWDNITFNLTNYNSSNNLDDDDGFTAGLLSAEERTNSVIHDIIRRNSTDEQQYMIGSNNGSFTGSFSYDFNRLGRSEKLHYTQTLTQAQRNPLQVEHEQKLQRLRAESDHIYEAIITSEAEAEAAATGAVVAEMREEEASKDATAGTSGDTAGSNV